MCIRDRGSTNPVPPYGSWATAAADIQSAVDAALPGALVWVSNGVYALGGRAVYGMMTNRVAVDKPLTLQSVNGPAVTVIQGCQLRDGTNADGATRCVYLTDGAVLSGFTLSSGGTRSAGDDNQERSGGGVWCASLAAPVTNCVLTGNSASFAGGGAYQARLDNCTLTGNSASSGGGAYSGALNYCTLTGNSASNYGGGVCSGALTNCTLAENTASDGGGAASATLDHCTLTGNSASDRGGGVYSGMLNNCTLTRNSAAASGGGADFGNLNNCLLTSNSAGVYGGGAYYGTLNNCTVTGNSAQVGGGAYDSTLNNCIVWFNTAPVSPNYDSPWLNYCCTTPLPAGGNGNISADPQLASASHLSANSPCRGAGSVSYATGTDIDDEPWLSLPLSLIHI